MYSSYYKQLKTLSLSIAFLGALTGCSDNVFDNVNTNEKNIRFNVETSTSSRSAGVDGDKQLGHVLSLQNDDKTLYLIPEISQNHATSRGTLIDNSTIASFSVFAAYRSNNQDLASLSPDYMYNVEITKENGWAPAVEYLWPGSGTLHFTAVSPYAASTGQDGITRLPSTTDKGELTIDYTVKSNVTEQTDLMVATAKDASSSPCDLQFNHALTSIRFETGDQMYPATIKSISISGVKNTGTLNLETIQWSEIEGDATYTINPNIELIAATGSEYVAPNTVISGDSLTFIVLPQTVSDSGELTVTIDSNGTESTFTTSLAGINWTAGTTVTYHLSINPVKETLSLDVLGDFSTQYTGGKVSFTVKSNYINKTNDSIPVKWKAEFVDDNDNVIDCPYWITSFPTKGGGDTLCIATTQMQNFVFDKISKESQILQDAADINQASGYTPYNLSSSTGSSAIENTANCYIVNQPGTYSIPLVYGNAIKNSATNTDAYTVSTHAKYMLTTFLNNFNRGITDPYIYNNEGCEPDNAYMVWEDRLNLVRNIKLSDDKKTITFDVPHSSIRQGNAMIAVQDKDSNILWSWHIWITDYNPENNLVKVDTGTETSYIFHRNVGQLIGDDITNFGACNVKIRFTQTDTPEGLEPLTKTVTFNQSGTVIETSDCFTYYQWGRKDPIMATVKQWYNKDNQEIKELPRKSISTDLPSGEPLIVEYIKTPMTFWTADHSYVFSYVNLWNMHNSRTESTKTIYDPSPAGYKVPLGNEMDYLIKNATLKYVATTTSTEKEGVYVTTPDGDEIYLPLLGYRSGSTAQEAGKGSISECWYSSSSTARVEAYAMVTSVATGNVNATRTTDPRTHALGVRPVKE